MSRPIIKIGETIKVENFFSFPDIDMFKPLFPIPSDAINVQVYFENKSIYYERFNKYNYASLQNYLHEACSPNEEGYIQYDGGFEINTNGVIVETSGGYCDNYKDFIPRENEDIIMVNVSGMRLPLSYISVIYELRKDPTNNFICYGDIPTYILPEDSYVWYHTKPIREEIVEDLGNIIEVTDTKGKNRFCFSYGTKGEYEKYDSRKNMLWGLYIAISLAIFAIFIGFVDSFYTRNNKKYRAINIILCTLLLLLWIIFIVPFKYHFMIIPPFNESYSLLINLSFVGIIILYFVSFGIIKWRHIKSNLRQNTV
ncbi:MAG: hypothetical protein KAU20_05080 [Nanoarchaeota archaeon]|nr:hypothetical protein [Nanoarchaeota archaeon]